VPSAVLKRGRFGNIPVSIVPTGPSRAPSVTPPPVDRLSRDGAAIDAVWIGNRIYRIL
jgi:hypothetical protein